MTTLATLPDVLKAEDVARLLGVGRNLVYEQAKEGTIPGAFRIGRALRFSKASIARWLQCEESPQ